MTRRAELGQTRPYRAQRRVRIGGSVSLNLQVFPCPRGPRTPCFTRDRSQVEVHVLGKTVVARRLERSGAARSWGRPGGTARVDTGLRRDDWVRRVRLLEPFLAWRDTGRRMVRKGSPVRVRQRAPQKSPAQAGSFFALDAALAGRSRPQGSAEGNRESRGALPWRIPRAPLPASPAVGRARAERLP
jgi:hypothetical protein